MRTIVISGSVEKHLPYEVFKLSEGSETKKYFPIVDLPPQKLSSPGIVLERCSEKVRVWIYRRTDILGDKRVTCYELLRFEKGNCKESEHQRFVFPYRELAQDVVNQIYIRYIVEVLKAIEQPRPVEDTCLKSAVEAILAAKS